MKEKNFILIDGHALAFRSYFALERTGMKTTSNEPTWAVFGFFKAIFDLLRNEKIKPDSIAVAFDVGRQTFRVEEYPEYKANRETMPDTLRSQMRLIFEGLKAFNIPIYTKEGFEADDVIGTISKKATELNHNTFILTGDRDAFQLVDKNGKVKVLIPSKGELIEYDWHRVFEKMGVYPCQIADLKGLAGDTSDNIPGIRGIGDKTASNLLNRFATLENIFNHLSEIPQKALNEKLTNGEEIAKLSKYLATIKCDIGVDFDFEKTSLEIPNTDKITNFFKRLQFYGFLKNIENILKPFDIDEKALIANEPVQTKIEQSSQMQLGLFSSVPIQKQLLKKNDFNFEKICIDTKEKLESFLNEISNQSLISIDTETTSFDFLQTDLVGISFAYNEQIISKNKKIEFDNSKQNKSKSFYIPLFHLVGEQLELNYVLEKIKPIIENEKIKKTFQNAKFDLKILKAQGLKVNGVIFDTMLASYVKDPSRRHGLKIQASEHLDYVMKEIEELIGTGKNAITMERVDIKTATAYACDDALMTLELTRFWQETLSDEEKEILYNIEIPLTLVLEDMEYTGVSINKKYLEKLKLDLDLKINNLEEKIFEIAGEKFNVNSPKQVSEILFNKLKIKRSKKTKTGFSTNAKILEDLANDYEIAKLINEHRQYSKLNSTYVETLPELISPVDGRIHTSFNQTITATGRLSSSNPNLQNIPIKTEIGNKIRGAFIPKDSQNYLIMSADYSQIELRLLAHCSRDDVLIEAFCEDEDIHTLTASKIFGVSLEEVTKEMRFKAKTVNFGIVYGQTKYGLSKVLDISPLEAQEFIDRYFQTYPEIKKYMSTSIHDAYEKGYAQTIYGRKRYLADELMSSNVKIKEFAQRAAINTPLQGSASDLIKIAMINLYKKLQERNLKSKIIIQVHDELVLEVLKSEEQEVKELVIQEMEVNQPLLVPLKVDVNISESWLEV